MRRATELIMIALGLPFGASARAEDYGRPMPVQSSRSFTFVLMVIATGLHELLKQSEPLLLRWREEGHG